jgi:hypothetical protein
MIVTITIISNNLIQKIIKKMKSFLNKIIKTLKIIILIVKDIKN